MSRILTSAFLLAAAPLLAGCHKPAPRSAAPVPGIGGLQPATPQANDVASVPAATPAPPPAGGSMPAPLTTTSPPIDLLKLIDVARDARIGVWTIRGGAIVSPMAPAAALQIPYQPPPAYRWTVVAQRESGSGSLNLGFVIEQHSAMCVLEGWDQKLSGLSLLDGRTGDNNATTVRERVLRDGQPNIIVITVRPSRVVCEINGQTIIDWTGSPQQLSLDRRYWKDLGGQLILGSWDASFVISKCQVEVLPLAEALGSGNQAVGAGTPASP